MAALGRTALRLAPWIGLALCALLVANDALAQSTGGSFGGGDFSGGSSGGSSGGGYSGGGGDDGGGDLISFILYVVFSRLPWPLKVGIIGIAVGGYAVHRVVKKRRKDSNSNSNSNGIDIPDDPLE